MDEIKLARQREAAARVQDLLQNVEFTKALDYLKTTYIEAWQSAASPERREECWYMHRALCEFKAHLEKVIAEGSLANRDLERLSGRIK